MWGETMNSPWENAKFAELSLRNIDEKFLPQTSQQVSFLLECMKMDEKGKLLDLGCGAGRHAIEFVKNGICVTGIDISSTMIEKAKQRALAEEVEIEFIEANLLELDQLPVYANSFDGAICLCESGIGVIGGAKKDLHFFTTVCSLLKHNAFFIFSCFNGLRRYIRSRDKNPKFDFINGTLLWSAKVAENESEIELTEIQRLYIPAEIKLLLSLAGFKRVEIGSCVNNEFSYDELGLEDIEMLVIAQK